MFLYSGVLQCWPIPPCAPQFRGRATTAKTDSRCLPTAEETVVSAQGAPYANANHDIGEAAPCADVSTTSPSAYTYAITVFSRPRSDLPHYSWTPR